MYLIFIVKTLQVNFVKSSRNKKGLNDVTAAPFLVGFFAAGSWEKDTKNGAVGMSLRPFLFCDNFSNAGRQN